MIKDATLRKQEIFDGFGQNLKGKGQVVSAWHDVSMNTRVVGEESYDNFR